MKKSFEKYSNNLSESENDRTKDVLEKEWKTLEIIAQVVGGDFGMKIIKGKAGEGSFFDPEKATITLDPLHIESNPELAKFVAGHEGSHRAITPNPKELGLSSEKIKDLYSQIGFGFLQNVIEDPAVNDWLGVSFPGLRDYVRSHYDKEFAEDGVVLSTPETQRIASKLGYWPKFAQYGSELIRDWHQKRFSNNLDPEVEKSLKRTIQFARESINNIPKTRNKDEIINSARQRFQNNTKYIWPEVKRLVEMDVDIEKYRQMLKDFNQNQKDIKQKTKEKEDARKNGNNQRAEELEKEIEELKRLFPIEQLSEEAKREIQKGIDKAIKDSSGRLNSAIEENQRKAKELKDKRGELEKEIEELKERAESAEGAEKEELEKDIQKKEEEKKFQESEQKKLEQEMEALNDDLENIEEGDEMPFSVDDLSKETQKELKKLFNNLPQKKKRDLEEKAKKEIENLEDILNEQIDGKLNNHPEAHKERRDREKKAKEQSEEKKKKEEERRKIEEKVKKKLEENATPYEKRRVEVATLINDLYNRLMRILKPQEYGGDDDGYPSGQFLDINRAMQAEGDLMQNYKIWKRDDAPEIRDYRFWHLVDLSGSMDGEKIEEMFKGLIIVGEAIGKLEISNSPDFTIRQGISGFHDKTFLFKELNEHFSQTVKEKLSQIFTMQKGSTDTYIGTKNSLEKLMKDPGETGNFLLTFSDGSPNQDVVNELKNYLAKTKKERERLKIKVGLIWLDEMGNESQLQNLVKEYNYDFGLVMPAIKNTKDVSFSQKLADLLEDIVKNPEKY